MRNVLIIFTFLSIVALGIYFGLNIARQGALSTHTQNQAIPVSPPLNSPNPISFVPKKLVIEKIGINSDVESVDMDTKGRMDVPTKTQNVAWYNLGYKPGEKGSAVIAGHLDTASGAPAVFWDLTDLVAGDNIVVKDDNGNELSYVVIKMETYDFDKFPLQEVFGQDKKAMLNLITCEGIFDKSSKNYSKRVVVYSELKR